MFVRPGRWVALGLFLVNAAPGEIPRPELFRKIRIPEEALTRTGTGEASLRFGGDLRVGDMNGDGAAEFLVYRSVDDAHDGGGMKPCFMAAFDLEGALLWRVGENGDQPSRPGPVALYDLDRDGADEVICFFHTDEVSCDPETLADVVLQIRDGATGAVRKQAAPRALVERRGRGPNWVHQRILVANLRGTEHPRDFVVKLGDTLLAFTEELDVLWTYTIRWNAYGNCSAYIPCVGDMDGDGREEVNGGYFLLGPDGTPHWEKKLGPHMDSVAIAPWDQGRPRAICSGAGHVMDLHGEAILRLGEKVVPHGQEVRVARFQPGSRAAFMALRCKGHAPPLLVVNTAGEIVRRMELNRSPNNTGMEVLYWRHPETGALLYHGGMLWDVLSGESMAFPGLPPPRGPHRQGWYHLIPANLCGDGREEAILYNPWDDAIYIYTPAPFQAGEPPVYSPGPRQYNPRLMD